MLDKAIISVFCIVLILTICIVSFEMIFTVVLKVNFDNQCRNTLIRIDMDGGLKNSVREILIGNLRSSGFVDIDIEAPDEVGYGETIDFNVYARHSELIGGFFGMMFRTGRFGYENSVTSRKIHNDAF